MKSIRLRYVLLAFSVPVILTALFVTPRFISGEEAQTGDVVYATGYPMFYTRGCDPATHGAGIGPLLATTVFEGIVDMGVDLKTLPSVARSWKIARNWKYIDFNIKKGITFHNGDPLTAEDVKFSLDTAMRPRLGHILGQDYIKRIKSIKVINKYKVRFNLKTPAPGLWKRFWWNGAIMPKKYRESVGDKGFSKKPVGSGPFKLIDYKQDRFFKMEAVKKHHRKTPEFKTLKIVYVPEHSTRLAMIKAGEADIIELAGQHIPVVKGDSNLKFKQVKYTTGSTLVFLDLAFPKEKSPFKDIRVRKAVSLAIDRETICRKIFFGGASPWGEVLCPYNLGFDPSIKPDPYDPKMAKKLLARAGYSKGFETLLNGVPSNKYWIEAIAANLADVGIKAKVTLWEGGSWFGAHRGKKLRGLKTRNSWYDAEPHPGADIQNGYVSDTLWAYVKLPGVDKAIKRSMYAASGRKAAAWGRKLSRMIRKSYMRPNLWANHSNYGLSRKILKWEPQAGSYPGTRFEYMKIKH